MFAENFIDALGEWEGYDIGTVQRFEAGADRPRAEVLIELHPMPSDTMCCEGCGQHTDKVHDLEERWVQDLPILDAQTHLLVWRRRVACPRCGPRLERLSWLEPYERVTNRFAVDIARLCEHTTVKAVAEHFGLGWDAVKRIHKKYLHLTLGPPNLEGVEFLVMDEIAIQKGHRYATVVIDGTTRRVLWCGRGKDRESVRPFFEMMGPERCGRIRAVAMDMHAAFEAEVALNCPGAEVVYDLFHVVAKYGREVIDRVRVDEANRVRDDKKAREVVKGSRWLLLRNKENITKEEDRVRLADLLEANKALMMVYVLKEDLKHLWDYRSRWHAKRFWQEWYQRAASSGLKPLMSFARNLGHRIVGILAHCKFPLNTSVLEGMNNKIKVIKRMAYGFRDDDYFFLRIRAAFPGIPG